MRPPPTLVLLASLAVGASGAVLAGCSDDAGDTPTPDPSVSTPTSGAGSPQTAPCERTAVVDGVGYHERGVYGDYRVDTSVALSGPLSPCAGVAGETTTFHPVVGVRRQWALVAEVGDQEVFFLTDRLPPVPSDSEFARILIGDQADTP